MRIDKIKISGFKSFVDPTTISLPDNLTGVVGPNGCGKSNIIDAMQWVMGESSAKHLRGDSMADVIFSGSGSRKPVSQASVELLFDNSDAAIGGQYAAFGELSIRRTVGRDGVSSYFLNGTRCRRRDITDVFLGTGLGVRGSYSVIEQGMISRVVEAKPEEVRGFLEEAAGISKYRERRRETENRIRHTRENLARLDDIREELAKQLSHLHRQAKAAERYQTLKSEERELEAQLMGLRWRSLEAAGQALQGRTGAQANKVEEARARLRQVEHIALEGRENHAQASTRFNECQRDFYANAAEISRLEQAREHAHERLEAHTDDLDRTRRQLEEIVVSLCTDHEEVQSVRSELAAVAPQWQDLSAAETDAQTRLDRATADYEQWQQAWDAHHHERAETARLEHAEQVHLEHLEHGDDQIRDQRRALEAERQQLDDGTLRTTLAEQQRRLQASETGHEELSERHRALRGELETGRRTLAEQAASLHRERSELERLNGRQASLQTLQEAALGRDQDALRAWLSAQALGEAKTLAESMTISVGWERAAEAVLKDSLAALCGQAAWQRLRVAGDPPPHTGHMRALGTSPGDTHRSIAAGTPRLLDKIDCAYALDELIAEVYVAEDLAEAQRLLADPDFQGSVVTRDGTWLGPHWIEISSVAADDAGILARERTLETLRQEAAAAADRVATLETHYQTTQMSMTRLEAEESRLAEEVHKSLTEKGEVKTKIAQQQAALQQFEARREALDAEIESLAVRTNTHGGVVSQTREKLAQLQDSLTHFEQCREALVARREAVQKELDTARNVWHELNEQRHDVALKRESLVSREVALEAALTRNATVQRQLEGRCQELESAIANAIPHTTLSEKLDAALVRRTASEETLAAARAELDKLAEAQHAQEQQRLDTEQLINERQKALEDLRLEARTLEVKQQEIVARLEQSEEALEPLLGRIAPDASEAEVQKTLAQTSTKITRLGAINLAAIDECAQVDERKRYLDQQHADLSEALATLEQAIRKIDKDTRTRFKETFDAVNTGLKTRFPLLFGGGHAYLEMTDDDLLETGVTLMARPPGKRISTIHLLSGGEKALTALAFVFALFELNPAPFCLLDEVDAPLDDANVARLTEMLRTMAQQVQFLFITHNKLTMEIATQLIGVTMQEAGVSRLVSVNMDEAVALAATA